MGSSPFPITPVIFILPCLLLSISSKSVAQVPQSPPVPRYANACYEAYTSQVFRTNLATLLLTLNSSDPSSYAAGFNQTTIGDGEDRLYGLFLCRADLTPVACKACVANASQTIPEVCPDHRESTIWYEYDMCSLTYSYKNIFNTVSDTRAWWFDSENISLPTDRGIILNSTLDLLIPEAANALVAGKKFAVNKTKFTESEPLYTLAQCTPDLSPENCKSCLQKAYDWGLPRIADGGVALLTNCIIRFEKTAFYDETAIPLLSPDLVTAEVPQPPPTPRYANACYEPYTSQVFQTNLATLLFALNSSDPSSYATGFNRTIIGDGEDRLYGLFFCRADLSSAACETCVAGASQKILEVCPDHRESTIWYEYDICSLTYSYKNIFNTVSDTRSWWFDSENITLPTDLGIILNSTLDGLIPEAANAHAAGKKFAVKKTKFTKSEPLYTLAQCTPDLTIGNCKSCLQKAYDWGLPRIADGGVALLTNCIMRFERTAFYNESAIALLLLDPDTGLSTGEIVAIVVSCTAAVVFFAILSFYLWNRVLKMEQTRRYENVAKDIKTAEQFDFAAIQTATNNFSTDNKLGEGGFGIVYKGVLHDGQEVAVKRLFNSTSQGIIEFKNEVNVVAKLQHRNLVRLLGFCVEKGEKILVFEYMPNKSLDFFLVDSEQQRGLLDWPRRYSIISGIAQGMLYLHEYSRLRIIHRDLKTGNILLDADMHPKISDFGMARIVGFDQTQETASKVAGTLGYMPPEYLRIGHFSVKSDVYSFGMLILEIIVGMKNNSFYDLENAEDLPSYVWKHWKESAPMEVLDPILKDSCTGKEVIRCIHISLLCLQKNPDDRPTMAMIDEMLKNFAFDLPEPQPPAFFHQDGSVQHHRLENIVNIGPEASVDKQTITLLKAR